MVVFGLKSALVPLYVWLPRAYSSATAPVAALFAIMTKVGLYAIIRTSTLVFGAGGAATADITAGWGLPLALATLLVGAFGAAAARRLSELVAYVVIVSVGTILVPIHVGSAGALAAAL
ncbi:MAG: proton-conducting transporter membrane subunit, partial [Bradymonadaceae bacterium]